MSLSFWCKDEFGPLDEEYPDLTRCFQYTCFALPTAVVFIISVLLLHCIRGRTRRRRPSVYQQLIEAAEDEETDVSTLLESGLTQLCTPRTRALWLALAVLSIFPFAEITIRFVLGEFVNDDEVYPTLCIIVEALLRSAGYLTSVWVILSSASITPMVRIFWLVELLVTAKEVESGVLRSVYDGGIDKVLCFEALQLIFVSIVGVYAWRPLLVGENNLLWPAQSYGPATIRSISPVSFQTNQATLTNARDRSLSGASNSVWNAFLGSERLSTTSADAKGMRNIPPRHPRASTTGAQRGSLGKSPNSVAGSYGADSSRSFSGGPDLSDAALRITTWLVRTKGRGEEVDFAIQVSVPLDVGRQLGGETAIFVVWRGWPRFRILDAQIEKIAAKNGLRVPCLPSRRSGTRQTNLEASRTALEIYINQVITEPKFWRVLSNFLHVETRLKPPSSLERSRHRGMGSASRPKSQPLMQQAAEAKSMSFQEKSVHHTPPNRRKKSDVSSSSDLWPGKEKTRMGVLSANAASFFEHLFKVGVSEWSKYASNDNTTYLVFTLSVKTKLGESWETPRKFIEFRKLREAIRNHAKGMGGVGTVPMLPKKGESEEAVKQVEGFLQEVANTSLFHCHALFSFLQPPQSDSKSTPPPSSAQSTQTLPPPQNNPPRAVTPPIRNDVVTHPSVTRVGSQSVGEGKRDKDKEGGGAGLEVRGERGFLEATDSPSDTVTRQSGTMTSLPTVNSDGKLEGHRRKANASGSSHRFEADITGYTTGVPTLFTIHVREYYSTSNYIDYNVRKRYSEFEKLRKDLVTMYGNARVPQLPSKFQGFDNKNGFLLKRCRGLEVFLKRVINTEIFQGHELFAFLAKNQAQRPLTLGSQVAHHGLN